MNIRLEERRLAALLAFCTCAKFDNAWIFILLEA